MLNRSAFFSDLKSDLLQARLESHAQAFEGLLSLIPANEYYSKDNSVRLCDRC